MRPVQGVGWCDAFKRKKSKKKVPVEREPMQLLDLSTAWQGKPESLDTMIESPETKTFEPGGHLEPRNQEVARSI